MSNTGITLSKRPDWVLASGFNTKTSVNKFLLKQAKSRCANEPLIVLSKQPQKGCKGTYYCFAFEGRYRPEQLGDWAFFKRFPINDPNFITEFEERWMLK
jgi:hypothetical protein